MPESVKITELPELTTVVPNDIIVVVDENETQTGRATLQQVKNLDSGPNSVKEFSIATGAATASKLGFSGPDKIISRSVSGAGGGEEFPCSPYARGLLAVQNGVSARDYLDALQSTDNPIFTGQVTVAAGSEEVPAIVGLGDASSGLYFQGEQAIAFASAGITRWGVAPDGTVYTTVFGSPTMRPAYGARAWVTFNGLSAAGTLYQIIANQHGVAARYGLPSSGPTATIGDTAATREYLIAEEAARGLTLSFPVNPTFNDSYGKGNFPRYNLGTENRSNYTSPGNNGHWVRVGSSWVSEAASDRSWIGTIDLTTQPNQSPLIEAGNVASVQRLSTGVYRLNFSTIMPDTNYGAIAMLGANTAGVARLHTRTQTDCQIVTTNLSGAAIDPAFVTVAIYR